MMSDALNTQIPFKIGDLQYSNLVRKTNIEKYVS